LILLVNAGVVGFLAQNLLLFVLFYEVELIPFYLLISLQRACSHEVSFIQLFLGF